MSSQPLEPSIVHQRLLPVPLIRELSRLVSSSPHPAEWQFRRRGRHTWTRIPSHRGIHSLLPRAQAHTSLGPKDPEFRCACILTGEDVPRVYIEVVVIPATPRLGQAGQGKRRPTHAASPLLGVASVTIPCIHAVSVLSIALAAASASIFTKDQDLRKTEHSVLNIKTDAGCGW